MTTVSSQRCTSSSLSTSTPPCFTSPSSRESESISLLSVHWAFNNLFFHFVVLIPQLQSVCEAMLIIGRVVHLTMHVLYNEQSSGISLKPLRPFNELNSEFFVFMLRKCAACIYYTVRCMNPVSISLSLPLPLQSDWISWRVQQDWRIATGRVLHLWLSAGTDHPTWHHLRRQTDPQQRYRTWSPVCDLLPQIFLVET